MCVTALLKFEITEAVMVKLTYFFLLYSFPGSWKIADYTVEVVFVVCLIFGGFFPILVCEVILKYQLIFWLDEHGAGLHAHGKLCWNDRQSLCLECTIKFAVPCSSFLLLHGNSVPPCLV